MVWVIWLVCYDWGFGVGLGFAFLCWVVSFVVCGLDLLSSVFGGYCLCFGLVYYDVAVVRFGWVLRFGCWVCSR